MHLVKIKLCIFDTYRTHTFQTPMKVLTTDHVLGHKDTAQNPKITKEQPTLFEQNATRL